MGVSPPEVGPGTRLAGVIGFPARHSLSPALHNAGYRALGLDWAYGAFEVPPNDLGSALLAIRALGLGGLSVTMPHKEAAVAYVDELSGVAATLRMVNAVSLHDGRLIGHNTDGDGLVAAINGELGVSIDGAQCAVLGAGGAAVSIIEALARHGAAEVNVVNRTPDRARSAASFAGPVGRVGDVGSVSTADLVVNATPVGMGDDPSLPLPVTSLRSGQLVIDTIYHPRETPLLAAATALGCRTMNGVPMLLHVSAQVFEIFTGSAPPLVAMRSAVADRL